MVDGAPLRIPGPLRTPIEEMISHANDEERKLKEAVEMNERLQAENERLKENVCFPFTRS